MSKIKSYINTCLKILFQIKNVTLWILSFFAKILGWIIFIFILLSLLFFHKTENILNNFHKIHNKGTCKEIKNETHTKNRKITYYKTECFDEDGKLSYSREEKYSTDNPKD